MTPRLYQGDCRDYARDAAFLAPLHHAIITDPPYALVSISKRFGSADAAPAQSDGPTGVYGRASAGFMGKKWDTGETAFDPATWRALGELLPPGGHIAAFCGTRTYHRLACAIEDAGFEIRDCLSWLYGTGFPKSHDVSKAIDKRDAAKVRRGRQLRFTTWVRGQGLTAARIDELTGTQMGGHYTAAASQPAVATREHFEKLRPFFRGPVPSWIEALVEERTVESENFKRREVVGSVPSAPSNWTEDGAKYAPRDITRPATPEAQAWEGWGTALKPAAEFIVLARKPLEGRTVAECVLEFGTGALNIDACRVPAADGYQENAVAQGVNTARTSYSPAEVRKTFAPSVDGRFPANVLHDGSDEVRDTFPDPKNARFFYSAKATKADRAGSKHPTVKPVALMRWLVDLLTPPGGHVLDPFAGSGTTGEACRQAGVRCTLVEREDEYAADIRRRFSLDQTEAS